MKQRKEQERLLTAKLAVLEADLRSAVKMEDSKLIHHLRVKVKTVKTRLNWLIFDSHPCD